MKSGAFWSPRRMSKTFLSLCSKTWSRSDSPVSSFHADSRRQSGDRVRSRRSEKNTSALGRAAARMDLLKNLDLTPSSFLQIVGCDAASDPIRLFCFNWSCDLGVHGSESFSFLACQF